MKLSLAAQVLWAKTGVGARDPDIPDEAWHPVPAHMIDAAAVAGWVWDQFISPAVRRLICAGLPSEADGRKLLCWLAALHDLGKAGPVFQTQSQAHAAAVRDAGLPVWADVLKQNPNHARVSAFAIFELLTQAGWDSGSAEWPALVVGGHHGVFPSKDWRAERPRKDKVGDGSWGKVRAELFGAFTAHTGADLAGWRDYRPSLAAQLVLSGAVILADWLASTPRAYPYLYDCPGGDGLPDDYSERAKRLVSGARDVLQLGDRWSPRVFNNDIAHYRARFQKRVEAPRPVQAAAYRIAREAERPGLLLIEAPMGEGKTEAALVAAELQAAATGADGIFVGLPTQATSNQMFDRAVEWLQASEGAPTITLAHGKAMRHDQYRALLSAIPHGVDCGVDCGAGSISASAWMRGAKRALLSPVVIGTVDQLLLAGVSAKHAALRHLGLAGKVVVVDEVHAYDAYMSQILHRVLEWLGAIRVPVVLLSATLAAEQRRGLLEAYAGRSVVERHAAEPRGDAGYPRLTWTYAPTPGDDSNRDEGPNPTPWWDRPRTVPSPADVVIHPADASRGASVRVELLSEPDDHDDHEDWTGALTRLVANETAEGGCVLVLRNTVGRAQRTYEALRRELGADAVTLAHARFTAADRRRIEGGLIERFGPNTDDPAKPNPSRPRRHVVVATQVAEQSLDVDFDLLVTDLAPVDLALQRIGRMHRHVAHDPGRPGRLRAPRVVVVGHRPRPDGPPDVPGGCVAVYHKHLLWRTAAVLAGRGVVQLPADMPELVDTVYSDAPLGPPHWHPDMEREAERETARHADEQAKAKDVLLGRPTDGSLALLMRLGRGEAHDESTPTVQAQVRLGEPTIEVVLLRATADPGVATTVSAGAADRIPLDRVPEPEALVDVVLDQAVRMPPQVTEDAERHARPVDAWMRAKHPWLAPVQVLLLPADGSPLWLAGKHGGVYHCTYSSETGLEVTRE